MQFQIPILFLIFNRPDTTHIVFERIRSLQPKYLYVAADGPRIDKDEKERCELARSIAMNVDWECEVKTLFRHENLGCGRAVSEAINWFFENVDSGIILEDDCLVDTSFFHFAAELLEKYRNDDNVMHISANGLLNYNSAISIPFVNDNSYQFVQYPLIWGWATWKRAWEKYDYDIKEWRTAGDQLISDKFRRPIVKGYWKNIFSCVYNKEIDTWDYQWLFACLKHDGLCILPKYNLVENIGFGTEATHTTNMEDKRAKMPVTSMQGKLVHPRKISLSNKHEICLEEEVFGLLNKRPLYKRAYYKLKRKIFNL